MTSSFGWVAHSDRERREILEIIQLFQERDSRDELGIGSIRDAFSDMLFPGTSTIQTRAKYYLFVPWIYQDIERRRIPPDRAADEARRIEIRLIESLSHSDDVDGVIGIQARATLKQLPSAIYWQGLGRLGIRRVNLSQSQYHRRLGHFYRLWARPTQTNEESMQETATERVWHTGIPAAPTNFPIDALFQLAEHEAQYLRERVRANAASSLFSYLIDDPQDVRFPWEHPLAREIRGRTQRNLRFAQFFSETIWGAALLYNLMLAELTDRPDSIDQYQGDFGRWWQGMRDRRWLYVLEDQNEFWSIFREEGAGIPPRTKLFVEMWFSVVRDALASNAVPATITENDSVRTLISRRELALKRERARLENPRARELWGGASGAGQLDYRWPVARTIIADIAAGLRGAS